MNKFKRLGALSLSLSLVANVAFAQMIYVPPGSPCERNSDCCRFTDCLTQCSDAGRCQVVRPDNSPCDDHSQCQSGLCVGEPKRCSEVTEETRCDATHDGDCGLGHWCNHNEDPAMCRKLWGPNEKCRNGECRIDLICRPDENGTKRCQERRDNGEGCYSNQECKSGSCRDRGILPGKVCSDPGKPGKKCTPPTERTVGEMCEYGRCQTDGTCPKGKKEGQVCNTGFDCLEGLVCRERVVASAIGDAKAKTASIFQCLPPLTPPAVPTKNSETMKTEW